jgi:hypothetical protein
VGGLGASSSRGSSAETISPEGRKQLVDIEQAIGVTGWSSTRKGADIRQPNGLVDQLSM